MATKIIDGIKKIFEKLRVLAGKMYNKARVYFSNISKDAVALKSKIEKSTLLDRAVLTNSEIETIMKQMGLYLVCARVGEDKWDAWSTNLAFSKLNDRWY